ncbi:putative AlkP superfamily pyrophosphatase or phosphodiesterase [Pedobacter africanus]|uniref:AlkP superfamily pyrophosphatase or phosphodiesterase n=1 Tax=Pedobacter africanus TaxID=151894 RepID=A0ACC6KZN6_9SPHI|nr:ectonucleotide pyrophosphatase/phosphodiesterase [Pedobacter africanus]MDR6784531.1 putative AlkP superfamily pyrophosphatase or phosphodiesterase [Pedobacter africanus]
MKTNFIKEILLVVLTALILPAFSQTSKHVILISIDGFRPDFYLDNSWPAPNLQAMVKEGAHSKGVRGIFPSVTYPSHTTLITGALPVHHGITYNTMPNEKGVYEWTTDSRKIKSETLWQAVRKAGMKSASVSWPISVGAEIDYNLPEIWSSSDMSDRRSAIREFATPKGFFSEIEEYAIGKAEINDLNLQYLTMDENNSRMAAYIIRKYKPEFLSIHIVGVDGAQHKEGRRGKGVLKALASADHAVANILDALIKAGIKDSTTVIVTGDHGFVDINRVLAPNVWLKELGIDSEVGVEEPVAKFQAAGGAAFFHLKNQKDTTLLVKVRKKLAELSDEYKSLFRIVERAELDKIGADPHASFALAPVKGVYIQDKDSGPVLGPTKGGAHGYFPDIPEIQTGFIAVGPGIDQGSVVEGVSLEDIAPTAAALLGIRFNAPDGKVLKVLVKN